VPTVLGHQREALHRRALADCVRRAKRNKVFDGNRFIGLSVDGTTADAAVISGYLGKSDAFDEALAAFSVAYADQNEKDRAALKRAIRDGKVEAVFEKAK
jgi:hypothetical protein